MRTNAAALRGTEVLSVFALFLGLQLLIFPVLAGLGLALAGKGEADIDTSMHHWFSAGAMTLTFL